jgi:hypothetical protein
VDGVGQQGHGTGQGDDGNLEDGGDAEPTDAGGQRSHARSGSRDGVHALGGVVAVRREQVTDRGNRTVAVAVNVAVAMVVAVISGDIVVVAMMVRVTQVVTVVRTVARPGGVHALWTSVRSCRWSAAATRPSMSWSWVA